MGRLKLFIPLLLFIVLAILLWRGLSLDPTSMPSALVDDEMPGFRLPLLDQPQNMVGKADLPQGPLLINVWGTWCPTCVMEHPFLMQVAEKYGVTIVGLDYKDERAAALQWLGQRGNPYQMTLFDEEGVFGLELGVYGAPETYLVDAEGVIRLRHVGELNDRVWRDSFAPFFAEMQEAGQ